MAKLVDKLERLQVSRGPRLGFMSGGDARPNRSVALIALLDKCDATLAAAAVEAGADAILVREATAGAGEGSAKALKLGDNVPCGCVASATVDTIDAWDFALVELGHPADALVYAEGCDRALLVEPPANDTLLRTLEILPVDLIVLGKAPDKPALEGLLGHYEILRSTSKPTLVIAEPNTDSRMLRVLRDAGVAGFVVPIEESKRLKGLSEMRAKVDALPPKQSRRRRSGEVPSVGPTPAAPVPVRRREDEDDDGHDHSRLA